MISVGSYEAKTHLPSLLEKVGKGEEVIITKHGVPIAKLVPVTEAEKRDRKDVVQSLLKFAKGNSMGGMTIRDMIDEGRKY
jgi:prevent-host-death family protein